MDKDESLKDLFRHRERVCPVCGKEFLVAPENVYRLLIKGNQIDYCSYTCYRVVQKEIESGRKYKITVR